MITIFSMKLGWNRMKTVAEEGLLFWTLIALLPMLRKKKKRKLKSKKMEEFVLVDRKCFIKFCLSPHGPYGTVSKKHDCLIKSWYMDNRCQCEQLTHIHVHVYQIYSVTESYNCCLCSLNFLVLLTASHQWSSLFRLQAGRPIGHHGLFKSISKIVEKDVSWIPRQNFYM